MLDGGVGAITKHVQYLLLPEINMSDEKKNIMDDFSTSNHAEVKCQRFREYFFSSNLIFFYYLSTNVPNLCKSIHKNVLCLIITNGAMRKSDEKQSIYSG